MKLETERLILRPLVLQDHAAIQKHFPHWDVVKYLSARTVRWPYPADGAKKFLQNIVLPATQDQTIHSHEWFWGITTKDNADEVIGVIHLRRDPANGNRSFWIAQEYQGKGLMGEALEAVNDFAFDKAGFKTLTVKNAHENTASNKLKIKTGATLIDIVEKPKGHYICPDCTHQEVWHISRADWHNYKAGKAAKTAPQSTPVIVMQPAARHAHVQTYTAAHDKTARAKTAHGFNRAAGQSAKQKPSCVSPATPRVISIKAGTNRTKPLPPNSRFGS